MQFELNMAFRIVVLVLAIAATFGYCWRTSYGITRAENCTINLRSRPEVEYNLCGLDGDKIIAVSEREVMTTMLESNSKR